MLAMFRTLLCTIILLTSWGVAVAGFAFYISNYHLDDNVQADGIVVLTGGGGRIEYGLELLANSRGNALFISGVNEKVGLHDILGAISLDRITLGHAATNTIGNAQESTDWIKKRKLKSVLLVTADYHMPRALTEFSAQLPADVKLIPAPVKTRDYRNLSWVNDPTTRNIILAEFHKLIAAEIRHYMISRDKKTS